MVQCDQRQNLWMLYACDQLDPAERDALRLHLSTGCPTCAGALAEAEAAVAQLVMAVPPVAPPPGGFDRVLEVTRGKPPITPKRWWARVPGSAIAALLAIAATSGVWLYFTQDARRFWKSSNLVTVVLTSKTQPAARGQVWWDHDSRQWRVTVTNLSPTDAGREYELWLIPADGKPIRSQTFNVKAGGKSTLLVPVPPDVGATAVAAITDEPVGGSEQPTGNIHLAGKFE